MNRETGRRLVALLEKNGISRDTLERETGLSRDKITEMRAGGDCYLSEYDAVARVLHMDTLELLKILLINNQP